MPWKFDRHGDPSTATERRRHGDGIEDNRLRTLRYAERDILIHRPWMSKDEPDWAAWLASLEAPLALVEAASKRRGFFHPLVARTPTGQRDAMYKASLSYVHQLRAISVVLTMRTMLRAGEGRHEEARNDLAVADRLGASVMKNPSCSNTMLTGFALQKSALTSLAELAHSCDVDAECAAKWKADLERNSVDVDWNRQFESLRCSSLDHLLMLRSDPSLLKRDFVDFNRWRAIGAHGHIDWNIVCRTVNELIDGWSQAARDDRDAWTKAGSTNRDLRLDLHGHFLGSIRQLTFDRSGGSRAFAVEYAGGGDLSSQKLIAAEDRLHQHRVLVAIAIDLAAFRTRTGRYPGSLAELGRAAPEDRFGSTIGYERTLPGYRLFSLGMDMRDDRNSTGRDDIVVEVPWPEPEPLKP